MRQYGEWTETPRSALPDPVRVLPSDRERPANLPRPLGIVEDAPAPFAVGNHRPTRTGAKSRRSVMWFLPARPGSSRASSRVSVPRGVVAPRCSSSSSTRLTASTRARAAVAERRASAERHGLRTHDRVGPLPVAPPKSASGPATTTKRWLDAPTIAVITSTETSTCPLNRTRDPIRAGHVALRVAGEIGCPGEHSSAGASGTAATSGTEVAVDSRRRRWGLRRRTRTGPSGPRPGTRWRPGRGQHQARAHDRNLSRMAPPSSWSLRLRWRCRRGGRPR